MNYTKQLLKRFKNPKFVKNLKNPDGVGEIGNVACLPPEEKILINGNFIEIKKADKKDLVFSHDSTKNKIQKRFSREYKGKVITLKNALGKISLTSEHLVYAISVPKNIKFNRNKAKRILTPAWYHCEDLKKGDIVLYPLQKKISNLKYLKINISKLKYDFKSKKIPKSILLDNDFLRLCGYFLAEGHISEKKCSNFITLTFNTKEKEYIGDIKKIVKKIFNLDVTIREKEENNVVIVYIYSAILSRLFKELFNKGAKNKSIPRTFMELPIEKQASLIEGMWKGDGYINLERNGPRAGYVTISYNLAQQLKELLLRQKIVPSIYVEKEKKSKWANHQKAYRIHVGQRDSLHKMCEILNIKHEAKSYESITSWFDENYLYTPLTNVSKKDYSGKVYNLEVENSHSFVSEAFCLHNCGDIMHLEIKVADGKIEDIGFKTFGCGAAIASSDVVCELAKGKTLEEAKKLTKDDIVKKLGGMPPIKVHCSVLGIKALKKAIEDYEDTARCTTARVARTTRSCENLFKACKQAQNYGVKGHGK